MGLNTFALLYFPVTELNPHSAAEELFCSSFISLCRGWSFSHCSDRNIRPYFLRYGVVLIIIIIITSAEQCVHTVALFLEIYESAHTLGRFTSAVKFIHLIKTSAEIKGGASLCSCSQFCPITHPPLKSRIKRTKPVFSHLNLSLQQHFSTTV